MSVVMVALLLTGSSVEILPALVPPAATASIHMDLDGLPRPPGQAMSVGQETPGQNPPQAATAVPPSPVAEPADPARPATPTTPPPPPQTGQALPSGHSPQNDIVVTGRKEAAGDPLRAINAESFAVTQKVDGAVVGPVARTYKKTVPGPIRSGIHNFLYNLREPIVFLNFLLQLKPGKAVETVGRFAINSTIGAVGVVDIAKRKPFHLPRRSNGFANTLGYYGIKNGPFLFLPLVGPTTVRDLFGGAIDRLILPAAVGSPFTSATYAIPAGVLGALDHRSEFDQTLKDLHDNSPDPYAASRAFYLNRRQAEIDRLHGRGQSDPAGMTGPPPSVRPFVPRDLEPAPSTPSTSIPDTSTSETSERPRSPAPAPAPSDGGPSGQ